VSRRSDRRGASLAEAIVSLLLTLLIIQLTWWLASAARRAGTQLIQRSDALETERLAWHVLERELGSGLQARDWSIDKPTVLVLRAFRGVGEVCLPSSASDGGLVRYRGMRLPDPTKDSLLLMTASGEWWVGRLVSRVASKETCASWGSGEAIERWRWDPPVTGVLLARVFERGSYHLEDRAVRYRTGDAGRQPLTPEVLDTRGNAFASTGSGVDLRLSVVRGSTTRSWSRRITGGVNGG
jgi:hypothetical protein